MTDYKKTEQKIYTLEEACELLSISTATGRNWIKSGKLVPTEQENKKVYFSEDYIAALLSGIASGSLPQLKSRRNKTFVTGRYTYDSYIFKGSANIVALHSLLELLEHTGLLLSEKLLLCILRDCAEKLLLQSGARHYTDLLDDLVKKAEYLEFCREFPAFHKVSYTYVPYEDTLGYLYLSLCSLKDRKASGSYYTPVWLTKKLVAEHLSDLTQSQTILDPSCGTGCFLLQLPVRLPLQNIYGNDLNPVSIALARINLAMKYRISTDKELETLYQNFSISDYLLNASANRSKYDIILGNPPWGAKLSSMEKQLYQQTFSCAEGSSVEIFDLFIEQSLNQLTTAGTLSFILPEAVLNVKNHQAIRRLLLKNTHVRSVEYLGEVFDKVHCPSIILTLEKKIPAATTLFCTGAEIRAKEHSFTIQTERVITADSFSFLLSDREYQLLQKILNTPSCTTLTGKADFALGIVTGGNEALIHKEPAPGLEPVLKGTDISKYHINSYSGYIRFQPEIFQQTAPEQLYRAKEKLFYRFINKSLTFTYDDNGMLSLNSCNIVIPHIAGAAMKYVLAILNSSVAQFVFEKQFHSIKVLRSHLEQLPIPVVDASVQEPIIALVDILLRTSEKDSLYLETFKTLDKRIADLFGLNEEEYQILVKQAPC